MRSVDDTDLRQVIADARREGVRERGARFRSLAERTIQARENLYLRTIEGPAGPEMIVRDRFGGEPRAMLMFGSNNYLGLASHPYVCEQVRCAIDRFGAGVGGPPLLNGYTHLLAALEERLAALKGAEDAIVFPSGYQTNLGLVSCLMERGDLALYDEAHHASMHDGLKMSRCRRQAFAHNDVGDLRRILEETRSRRDTYICVESVYSMDGDVGPVAELDALAREHGAILVVDDAHGTGVLGKSGRGVSEFFGLEGCIDLVMGTFSKALASVGGFVAGSRDLVTLLRFQCRPYIFSAALTPPVLAAIHAGLDVLEREPDLVERLHQNVAYLVAGLRAAGIETSTQSAIVPLMAPADMKLRSAAYAFHERGVFINAIEWPAVPADRQRFRISVMAPHTRAHMDRLVEVASEVWRDPTHRVGARG